MSSEERRPLTRAQIRRIEIGAFDDVEDRKLRHDYRQGFRDWVKKYRKIHDRTPSLIEAGEFLLVLRDKWGGV